jgi:hypothetical protein
MGKYYILNVFLELVDQLIKLIIYNILVTFNFKRSYAYNITCYKYITF